MASPTLLASALFAAGTALVYAIVARVVLEREVSHESRLAATGFGVWWAGFALLTFMGALQTLWGAFAPVPFGAALANLYAVLAILSVALWGLTYYFVFLYTGKRSNWVLVAVYWVATFVLLVAWVIGNEPVGVDVGQWTVEVAYEDQTQSGLLYWGVIVSILVPVLIGAASYLRLLWTLDDRTSRFRVGAVSGAFLFWFGSSLMASLAGISQADWWQLASRFISLAAAFVVFIAYRPPEWLRAKGIEAA